MPGVAANLCSHSARSGLWEGTIGWSRGLFVLKKLSMVFTSCFQKAQSRITKPSADNQRSPSGSRARSILFAHFIRRRHLVTKGCLSSTLASG